MSETISVHLTEQQRQLLLQGLRFVRSNVRLTVHDPTEESDLARARQLDEIEGLTAQLMDGVQANPATTT